MAAQSDQLTLVRGLGAEVWDANGKRYIDCVAGRGSANVGHCHPSVVAAIRRQAERLLSCPPTVRNDMRDALLQRLGDLIAPLFGESLGPERIFLCNSGTEAVEAALKAARLATGRPGIVAARRSFHGRTMGALSTTWERSYREPFEPLVPEVRFVPFDDADALDSAVDDTVGLVLLEPVQGEGGVYPASPGYLAAASQICQTHGALLALDEVQTGFGRTGTMFACEQDFVVPDLMCLAKSIAGGLPMGALVMGPRVAPFPPGAHGSTFGGNPLVCAAAAAAIDVLAAEGLPARAAEAGAYLKERLTRLASPHVRVVRGRGLMIGIELRSRSRPFVAALQERGILTLVAGLTVLRLLPPLVITREQCDEVIAALGEILA